MVIFFMSIGMGGVDPVVSGISAVDPMISSMGAVDLMLVAVQVLMNMVIVVSRRGGSKRSLHSTRQE
jgi:hypothetical protein